ncbi:hypothetical protein ACGH6Q_11980 [Gilliamella sp. BG2]|uniref:hypothetical protein n=1 Tax=Gilliamella sp. BG2 TaxID=3351509 RepID=UPI0039885CD1
MKQYKRAISNLSIASTIFCIGALINPIVWIYITGNSCEPSMMFFIYTITVILGIVAILLGLIAKKDIFNNEKGGLKLARVGIIGGTAITVYTSLYVMLLVWTYCFMY